MQTTKTAAEKETVKKKSVGSVIGTIVLVLFILLAITAGYSAYTAKVGSGVPGLFGIRYFAVQSDSMAPTFYQGDVVFDKVVKEPAALQKGDVITFWTVINGQKVLNTHRIIEITDYGNYLYFDTKGDNNTIADTTGVHQNDIVGQYMFNIPRVGTVLDFMQTTAGFGLCIVLPVAIYFLLELISFFRTLMAYKTEKVRLELVQQQAQSGGAVPPAQPVAASQTEAVPQGNAEEQQQ